MPDIDPGTLRSLLNIGVAVFLAALLGGGLDASGLFKIPHITSKRVQLAVGVFGAVLMVGSLVELNEYQSVQSWDKSFKELRSGAAGLPPPKFPQQLISDDLEQLAVDAGADFWRNCEIAAFIKDHAVHLPALVGVKIRNAANTTSQDMLCYRQLLEGAENDATDRSSAKVVSAEAVKVLDLPNVVVATNDLRTIVGQLRDHAEKTQIVAQATEVALPTAGTDILEAAAAVGLRGWLFLGTNNNDGSLGDDRTVVDSSIDVGSIVAVRRPVNLHELGNDTEYRRHRVEAVIPPGARIEVGDMTPQTSDYRWAKIRIVSLPST